MNDMDLELVIIEPDKTEEEKLKIVIKNVMSQYVILNNKLDDILEKIKNRRIK